MEGLCLIVARASHVCERRQLLPISVIKDGDGCCTNEYNHKLQIDIHRNEETDLCVVCVS
jgi:hypothetical protein